MRQWQLPVLLASTDGDDVMFLSAPNLGERLVGRTVNGDIVKGEQLVSARAQWDV
jgi:hypothetical protein